MIFLTPHLVRESGDLDAIRGRKVEGASAFLEDNRLERRDQREEFFNQMINLPR
ncbi:MAG: hypothetical protein MPW15_01345 [Candidatus Manganitrophus sp.]|nr:hypothetical protein [Candidatus Manganitrophus sp.]